MWFTEAIAKIDIPLGDNFFIKQGSKITITKGFDYEFALWHSYGIYDLPSEYVLLNN
jgi:hypothetical protein